eukprot:scaffold6585_cov403-Prasinococcus_capsulatus_cf.AAC.2
MIGGTCSSRHTVRGQAVSRMLRRAAPGILCPQTGSTFAIESLSVYLGRKGPRPCRQLPKYRDSILRLSDCRGVSYESPGYLQALQHLTGCG